jgi:hypothetical protein
VEAEAAMLEGISIAGQSALAALLGKLEQEPDTYA